MREKYKQVAAQLGANDYEFKMGDYISKGWKLGTSVFGYFILFIIVSIIISLCLSMIPIVGSLANSFVVSPSIGAGFILFLHEKNKTGQSDFGLVFKGFNKVGPLLVLQLILTFIMLALFIPLILSLLGMFSMDDLLSVASSDSEAIARIGASVVANFAVFYVGMFISFLLVMVFMIFMSFTTYFIALGDLSAFESIKSSIDLVKKKFFSILLFGIVLVLINVAGVLALVIGIFVTMPVTMAAMYFMFYDIIGKQVEEDEVIGAVGGDVLDA
jgi:uncharacterized membrane protein